MTNTFAMSELLRRFLLDRSAAIEANIEHPYWIGGEGSDQGPSYCRACAETFVKNKNAGQPDAKKHFFVDGGFDGQTSDTVYLCEDCHKPLTYTLTEAGVGQEIEHFEDCKDEDFSTLSPQQAYELLELFDGGQHIAKFVDDLQKLAERIERQINRNLPHCPRQ